MTSMLDHDTQKLCEAHLELQIFIIRCKATAHEIRSWQQVLYSTYTPGAGAQVVHGFIADMNNSMQTRSHHQKHAKLSWRRHLATCDIKANS